MLGQAVARGLVREGARVVLGDIDKAGLERTAAELGGPVRWQRTDVTRRDDIAALFALCDKAFGPVEILVCFDHDIGRRCEVSSTHFHLVAGFQVLPL